MKLKIIKRSQAALLSLSFMLMIAGYINYKYDPEREKDLGKTVHVNSSDIFTYENLSNNEKVAIYEEARQNNSTTMYNNKSGNKVLATFKSQRDDMFSELEETYKTVIDSDQDSKTKEKYQEKLDGVIEKKHLITLVESIIKSKGIEDVAIVPTGENVNIIVNSSSNLTNTQVALIEQIVTNELNIDASKITITQNN